MGYALFANRKLMLTNSINMLNLQLTDIMNKRMDLTELGSAVSDGQITAADIASCKQSGVACEYGVDMFATKITKYGDEEYYAGLATAKKEARENVGMSRIGIFFGKLFNTKKYQAYKAQVNEYKEQYEATKKEEKARQIQEQIAKMENELEKRQKTIETKIQAYQSDLEATEKAEANAIKNATPKYAGVQG